MAEDSMGVRLNRLRKRLEEYGALLARPRRSESDLLTVAFAASVAS